MVKFGGPAVYLFKYINKSGDEGFHVAGTGDLAHVVDVFLDLLVVEAEGVLLVEDGVDVLGVLAEDYGVWMGYWIHSAQSLPEEVEGVLRSLMRTLRFVMD